MKLLRTFVAIGFLTSLFLGCSGSSSSSSDDEDSISSSDAEGASDEKSSSSGKSKGNSSGTSGQKSSNSSSKSSSSAAPALVSPCRANGVDTCVYGILTDKRDLSVNLLAFFPMNAMRSSEGKKWEVSVMLKALLCTSPQPSDCNWLHW